MPVHTAGDFWFRCSGKRILRLFRGTFRKAGGFCRIRTRTVPGAGYSGRIAVDIAGGGGYASANFYCQR